MGDRAQPAIIKSTSLSPTPNPMSETKIIPVDEIRSRILVVRGCRVPLDSDLASFYGIPTHRFNEAVKRNASRFPTDFMFQINREELVQE